MLNEQKRGQLDTIVQEMTINKEKPETIQFVVDDFKKKYDEPEVEQPKKDGFFKSVGKAIAKPFGEVGVGVYNAAKNIEALATAPRDENGMISNEYLASGSKNLPFLGETKPFMTGEEGKLETAKKIVGYGTDIGSNVVGGFGVGQVAKQGFKGALRAGIGAGIKTGASTGALVGAGQSLEDNKDALNVLGNTLGGAVLGGATGGVLGGATATAGKVIRGVLQPGKTVSDIGKGIKGAGESIQQRVIKPTQKDIKAGFKIENVSKYDVGGNLGDSFVKVKDQIKSNMDELNNIVSTIAPKKRYKFDLENYVNELEDKYRKGGVKLLGQGKKVLNEVENLKGELDLALGNDWRDNLSGFEDVLDIKRRAGLNAAFMHDATKSQPTPEENVWTDFYMLLKDKLEKEAPPEFQAVNKRLSELIPIEQALIRRIPIAERQNVLNAADIVSLSAGAIDPRALTIGVLNRVLKSGTVANKLMQAGSKIEGAGAKLAPTDELIKSIPSNNRGFAKIPFSSPAVGKTAPKLNTLNPTGSVFSEYSPQQRALLELGENMTTLDKTMGKSPNEIVTIYRGTGAGKDIIPGDFITTNKQLAQDYAGNGKVLEKKVKLSDILDDKTEPLGEEYIYRPKTADDVFDPLIQEAKKYESAEEFWELMGGATNNKLREKGIKGKEQITKFWEDATGKKSQDSYKMSHRPSESGSGHNISDKEGIPSDVYEHPEWYFNMKDETYQESFRALQSIKGKPNAEITIYRASPKKELNKGDWITLSKKYAKQESLSENTPVNSFKVKAKDIQFAGDDLNEFGYFPTKK